MSKMQNPPSSSITPFCRITTSTNPNKQTTHWTSRSSISQTLGFNINFTDFTVKAGIAMLDWDAQSFVQSSKTERRIPVLKKIHVFPFKNPAPLHKDSWKWTAAKQQKFKLKDGFTEFQKPHFLDNHKYNIVLLFCKTTPLDYTAAVSTYYIHGLTGQDKRKLKKTTKKPQSFPWIRKKKLICSQVPDKSFTFKHFIFLTVLLHKRWTMRLNPTFY